MRSRNSLVLGSLLTLLVAALVLTPHLAFASDPLTGAGDKIVYIYQSLRRVVYIVGGIGIILLAVLAFFGKFRWMWFWALAGGIFLVAASSTMISWLGGDNTGISTN